MQHLDLCSGIGGFALAARWAGIETVGFCEIEDYPRRVLAKNFPGVPIHQDIHDLDGKQYGAIDLITAGYPCQPFSLAGKRRGAEDDRHIWPEVLRIVTEARPAWTLFENVFGHVSMGLDEVLSDLETEGYATRCFVVPACAVDAPHRRDRVWIVGYSISEYGRGISSRQREGCVDVEGKLLDRRQRGEETVATYRPNQDVAYSASKRLEGSERQEHEGRGKGLAASSENLAPRWATEPDVRRVAHGIPKRVDRIRGLGNAIVPQVAYQFMRLILDEHFVGNKQ